MLNALACSLAFHSPAPGFDRIAFRPNYSVVMPRPFLKRSQRIGPAFVGATEQNLYIVTATELTLVEQDGISKATKKGPEELQRFLNSYGISFSMAGKTLRKDAGAFHGLPSLRRVYELNSGERGALLAVFSGGRMYVMVCVNSPGSLDFKEADRFFDSFRIEKAVAQDPDLAEPPSDNYPPADENTGIA